MTFLRCIFKEPATTEIYTYLPSLSRHDALPVWCPRALVLPEDEVPAARWILVVLTCVQLQQLAHRLARRSKAPYDSELRNLRNDSIIAGSWVPLMHFTVLPAALVMTVATADKINTGVCGLWLR